MAYIEHADQREKIEHAIAYCQAALAIFDGSTFFEDFPARDYVESRLAVCIAYLVEALDEDQGDEADDTVVSG